MIKTIAGRYWTVQQRAKSQAGKSSFGLPLEKDMSKTKLTPLDPPELARSVG
jgi:hypothetical protein